MMIARGSGSMLVLAGTPGDVVEAARSVFEVVGGTEPPVLLLCPPSVLVAAAESDDPVSVISNEVNKVLALISLGKTVLMLLSDGRLVSVEEITSVLVALVSEFVAEVRSLFPV